ncbi:MAG: hypothetical protein ACYC5F_10995 [Thermoleophilia bacterium]
MAAASATALMLEAGGLGLKDSLVAVAGGSIATGGKGAVAVAIIFGVTVKAYSAVDLYGTYKGWQSGDVTGGELSYEWVMAVTGADLFKLGADMWRYQDGQG